MSDRSEQGEEHREDEVRCDDEAADAGRQEPSNDETHMTTQEKLQHGQSLYMSYFFAAWGDRMWEFAGIIFLMEIFPTTLLPSSLFGFFETLAGIASGTPVGKFIDNSDRLKVIKTSIIGQNVTVFLASVVFAVALVDPSELDLNHKWLVAGLIIVAGMAARVSSALNKISIHKDWTVVVADGCSEVQTTLNSNMRRVDLVCSLLAPLMVGLLSMWNGPAFTCKCIAAWSALSLVIELYVAEQTYQKVAPLRTPKQPLQQPDTNGKKGESFLGEQLANLRAYRSHKAFGISLPYCFLYMSVLSFHGTMVSFLRTLGWSDLWLAVGRGSAAVVAIGSTFAVPGMKQRYGLKKTALVTLWSQILALAPLALGFVYFFPTYEEQRHSQNFFIITFVTLCLSRFGLWGFDLAQTQLMQEIVEHTNAGAINGAQETLVNFCWLVSFGFTMWFDNPRDFTYPVLMSFLALAVAGLLYTNYYQDNPEDPASPPRSPRRSQSPSPSPSPRKKEVEKTTLDSPIPPPRTETGEGETKKIDEEQDPLEVND